PCPAAILIPGVGAHDRDYTLWGRPRFRALAEYLAGQGIGSLRFDERGVGASTADPAGATSADFAGDVLAWLKALRGRTDAVDGTRIGLVGHSEGGTIAALAAARSRQLAFVVLLASPGLPGREYNLQYEESMGRAMGLDDAAIAERRAFQERVLDAILAAPDSAAAARRLRDLYREAALDVPPERLERGIRRLTSPWFRFNLTHDPAATLEEVEAPVLAVFGGLDRQVPPAGNREALAAVLDDESGVDRVVVLPGLNHFFQTAETGAPEEYPRLDETLAPAALELIGGWIRTHTGPRRVSSCTVLHVSGDGWALGGNNEDWEDPATRFWIVPRGHGRYGWIKFGFAGGFPQGGMNERGLFWDATGVPYLAMPRSEAEKTRYHGPLMEKVMSEASSVAEARAIFDAYFCEDQYRAQYLVGDAGGASMIVEGDSILPKEGRYQVATNFYHSRPDLGGYPCGRYETARALLDSAGAVTPFLVGRVLEATHQEGRYPTQYSTIYDLGGRVAYLFLRHDFDEYLEIRLDEELRKGAASYDLAPLFSGVRLLAPADGATVAAASAELRWEGRMASEYRVCYGTSPDTLDACEPVRVARGGAEPFDPMRGGRMVALLPLVVTAALGLAWGPCVPWLRRRRPVAVAALAVAIVLGPASCGEGPTGPGSDPSGTIAHTVSGLEPASTYHWRVVATPPSANGFSTVSLVRSFTTRPESRSPLEPSGIGRPRPGRPGSPRRRSGRDAAPPPSPRPSSRSRRGAP
ncbi:MAG: alpha/beta fold hydrolase, partial [Gemmatimonadota bacterium]